MNKPCYNIHSELGLNWDELVGLEGSDLWERLDTVGGVDWLSSSESESIVMHSISTFAFLAGICTVSGDKFSRLTGVIETEAVTENN